MNATAGFLPLYQRRVALAVKRPIALVSQVLTPVLWVLVVGPALARVVGGFGRHVDYFTYIAIGQIVFVLPFSAMFAGLVVMQDRDFGILRELLVAPIRRATIPWASIVAVMTVAAGQVVLILALARLRGADFHVSLLPLIAGLSAAALLTAGTYGLAEYLAYTLTQPQTFGTLIPAIGATPYALCGAIYPIAALPCRGPPVRADPALDPRRRAVALRPDGASCFGAPSDLAPALPDADDAAQPGCGSRLCDAHDHSRNARVRTLDAQVAGG